MKWPAIGSDNVPWSVVWDHCTTQETARYEARALFQNPMHETLAIYGVVTAHGTPSVESDEDVFSFSRTDPSASDQTLWSYRRLADGELPARKRGGGDA